MGEPAPAAAPNALEAESGASRATNGVPVSTMVGAVRTLSSPPFMRRGVEQESGRIPTGGEDGGCPPRLQLAAVSVLQMLLTEAGAKYVARVSSGEEPSGEEEAQDDVDDADVNEGRAGESSLFVVCDIRSVCFASNKCGR